MSTSSQQQVGKEGADKKEEESAKTSRDKTGGHGPQDVSSESDYSQESDEDVDLGGGKVSGWSPSGKKKKERYVCKGGPKQCGLKILAKDDSIMCDACKQWYHSRCQKLSDKEFRALSEFDFLWVCMECRPNIIPIAELRKEFREGMENIENKITQALNDAKFKKEIEQKLQALEDNVMKRVKEQQERVEKSIKEQVNVVQKLPEYTAELKTSAKNLQKIVENKAEHDARERNILLHNIEESQSDNSEERKHHDTEIFQRLVTSLTGKQDVEIVNIYRLGKKPENNGNEGMNARKRLMLVKVKDREIVNELIRKRTKLREVGFLNVYLTRDLSPEDRESQKKLRMELEQKGKTTHKIFRGKVVPR